MDIFDRINKTAADGRQFEETLHALALQEVANRNIEPGLWAKAFADSAGDGTKALAAYLKLRVQAMKDELAAVNRVVDRPESEYGDDLIPDPDPTVPVPCITPQELEESTTTAPPTRGRFPTILVVGAIAVAALIGFSVMRSGDVGGVRDNPGANAPSTDRVSPPQTPEPEPEPLDDSLAVFQATEPYALIPDGTTAIETVAGTLWVANPSDSIRNRHLVLRGRPLDLSNDHLTLVSITHQGDQDIVLVAMQCGGTACEYLDLAFVRVFHNGRHAIERLDGFRFPTVFMDKLRDGISFRDANTDVALGLESGKHWFATIGPTEPLTLSSTPAAIKPLRADDCRLATRLLRECARMKTPCEDASFRDFPGNCKDATTAFSRTTSHLANQTTGLNLPAFAHTCQKASQFGMIPSDKFIAREICSGADPAQWSNASGTTSEDSSDSIARSLNQ
jgi:hypothetical protein